MVYFVLCMLADLWELLVIWLFAFASVQICKILFSKYSRLWFCYILFYSMHSVSGISWMHYEWENLYHFKVHQLGYLMSPACFFVGMTMYKAQTSISVSSCNRAGVVICTKGSGQWLCVKYWYGFVIQKTF